MRQRPILSITITLQTAEECSAVFLALNNLAKSGLQIQVSSDASKDQITIGGMDEQHLKKTCEQVLHDTKIEAIAGEPRVILVETVTRQAEGEGKYIRQSGASGNYGHVKIRVEPNAGRGVEFVNEIKGGALPEKYLEPIEQGIREAMKGGALAGHEIIDVKVTLLDGSYHDVDSNEMAFKIAGSIAFKEATRKARPAVLEPVMSVEVVVPEESMGTVIGDLNSRRGRIEGIEHRVGSQVIKANVPLRKMLGNPILEASRVSMSFSGYEPVRPESGPEGSGAGVRVEKPGGPRSHRSGSAAASLENDSL